jgi:hypothetical protein
MRHGLYHASSTVTASVSALVSRPFGRRALRTGAPLQLRLPIANGARAPRTGAEKIRLFRSLFRGRTDVFPKRWENAKQERSGYAPACANEWVRGVCEKPKVRCGECPNQAFIEVEDRVIADHLGGKYTAVSILYYSTTRVGSSRWTSTRHLGGTTLPPSSKPVKATRSPRPLSDRDRGMGRTYGFSLRRPFRRATPETWRRSCSPRRCASDVS